ncbi:MAG: hypothetical protein KTV68_13645 [Acidimicrobiia bacterium]|nr:hypothetical protein [Acidimicrobiia bacterium]
MLPINIRPGDLKPFGDTWLLEENLSRGGDYSSIKFGELIDRAVGASLAHFLGDLPIIKPNSNHLLPSDMNAVEVGDFRVVGGVRPQNFDVGYRPDGVRFAFDSKTLNDIESVGKNYQNMINDLATEATTVHTRFPYAVVAFIVAIPRPALSEPQESALIQTLERMSNRSTPQDQPHLAEAVSLLIWDPYTGNIDPDVPTTDSSIRIENFSTLVEASYTARYKGLPPH